jgi:hypothetical protein
MSRWFAALLGLLVFAGCGDTNSRPSQAPSNESTGGRSVAHHAGAGGAAGQGGTGQTAGQEGASGGNSQGGSTAQAAGQGGAEAGQAFAPKVTIRKPKSVAELAKDTPVISAGKNIEVVCRAVKASDAGAREVNPSTVSVVLVDADGEEHAAAAVTPSQDKEDEYTTSFAIGADYAPGQAEIRCTAEDSSSPPASASASAYVFIDLGPTIEIDSPEEGAVRAVKDSVQFKYRITPAPIADKDPGAEVSSAELTVAGQTFELEEDPDEAGTYGLYVNFSDRSLFSVSPTGTTSALVRAYNSRDPVISSELDHSFTLDGVPPVIKVTRPEDGSVVGGFVKLDFEITDDLAGVDPSTISVHVGQLEFKRDWGSGPKYSLEFDSANPEFGAEVQPEVRITASDKAGNANDSGASIVLYLDTVPPLVTLDPPNVRERKEVKTDEFECSHIFDPLGAAPNDLSKIPEVIMPRVMVWERTNSAPGQTLLVHAGTDEGSVSIYVQPDPEVPLLIDSNDDGYCDTLNTTDPNDDSGLSFTDLVPIKATGTSDFTSADSDEAEDPTVASFGCSFGKASAPPGKLCHGASDMTRVVGRKLWTDTGSIEAATIVFGLGPTDGGACSGREWEIAHLIPEGQEGWICLAARAQDNVGNVGVSRPLRLCLDRTGGERPECAETDPPKDPPTCTDGCIIPDSFDFDGPFPIDL